jgi:hypothetical protein
MKKEDRCGRPRDENGLRDWKVAGAVGQRPERCERKTITRRH